jgi:site-specific recombinase XerD
MRANLSLLFYLKRRNSEKTGPVPVYLRITVDNKRAELATGHQCEPEKWSNAAGKMMGTKESVREFNASLEELQRKIHAIADRLEREEEIITAEGLKMAYLGKTSSHRMILEIFGEHNRKAKALVGNGFAPGTIERYKTSLKHTKEFIQSKYRVDDLSVSRINHAFIAEYEFYLRSVRGCGNNTTVKYLNNFKKIIRICLGNGWMIRDPFINYKLRTKIVDRGFLNEQELKRMAEQVFEVQRLNTVRDIFLFSCYTGLAYVDVHKLKRQELVTGLDGALWVHTKREKTNTPSKIPLLLPAMQLINKYRDHPVCEATGKVFPVSSNQKMNAYLKEIADLCRIDKTLTYHVARHTFATTVTLLNGIPIESVSKMLGHTNIKTTQHYAKILDIKVAHDMAGLDKKLRDKGLLNVEANIGDQGNDNAAEMITSPDAGIEPEDKPEPRIIKLFA